MILISCVYESKQEMMGRQHGHALALTPAGADPSIEIVLIYRV